MKPAPASEDDQHRLAAVMRNRLRDGDRPTVVLHEMLQAGVSSIALRKVVNEALVTSERHHETARQLNFLGKIVGLISGSFSSARSTDKRDPKLLARALDDIDRWEQRFPG